VAVNVSDGTLEDGSPAHPDDFARFQPWRVKFEEAHIQVKRCQFFRPYYYRAFPTNIFWRLPPVHWIVNYELEKRFEEARSTLTEVLGQAPVEKMLFHGTAQANIDPYIS